MKRSVLAITISGVMLAASSAYAVQGRGGGPKPHPVTPSTHAPTAHGPSTTAQGHGQSHAPATHGPSSTTHGNSGTHSAAAATTHGSGSTTAATSKKSATTAATTTPATTTGADATIALTPVQQKLQRNTKLADKVASRLPDGTDLMTAAADFRNLGQFVAAVNVSNNLGIPFTDLKNAMVEDHLSLGQAIHELRPAANSTLEANRAETEATSLINSTTTTTTTTTTATPTTTTPTTTTTTTGTTGKKTKKPAKPVHRG